ncbi:MAG TPA: BTAD domain-containing putative transcriptional regulator [Thermoleophilaceae bacterium]|nr:BTAD domain-containing putative transcriptional regulator [Thermoleophilaceae bacterium]
MQFRLLGPLEVVTDDGDVDVGTGKRRALLAHLLINANEVVSAERLIDELWDEHPPATAAKSVQVYVSQLRRALPKNGEVLATRGSGYVVRVATEEVDALLFEDRLGAAQQALAEGDPESAAREARSALELWRGPALFDFAYDAFAQTEAARLDELRLVALETRIDADLASGAPSRVASELESLVAEHPLRERFRAQLMLALYRCGRQSRALETYREGRRLLLDQLGIEPSPELRDLEQRILTQSEELNAPRRVARVKAALSGAADPVAQPERRRRRGAWLTVAGATLVIGGGVAAIVQRAGTGGSEARVAVDAAPHSMVVVDPLRSRPVAATPLAGRPTDVTTGRGHIWVTTVDSPSLTSIDGRTHKIVRTTPLRGRPDAVAFGAGAIWIADGRAGVLARVRPGYGTVERRLRFPPTAIPGTTAERLQVPRATLAAGGGAIWLTNGSTTLVRVDPANNRTQRIDAGRRLTAVSAGAGGIWALAADTATVLRVDPLSRRITDRIPIVARRGPHFPAPTGIAAAADAVWVLNGNSATATRINPETRGVEMTVELGIDREPADIAASGRTAWVANFDGSLSRIDGRSSTPKSIWVGGSLERVAATPSTVWATTTALDQKLPGGSN